MESQSDNTQQLECKELYITGINSNASDEQVRDFFKKQFDSVIDVQIDREHSFQQYRNHAIVYFSNAEAIPPVIKAINFKMINSVVVKCHLNDESIRKAKKNPRCNVAIKFPVDYPINLLTERKIFEILEVFGTILDIRIMKENRIAFCHFLTEESAQMAIAAKCDCGVTIEPKKTKETEAQEQKQKKPQQEEKKSTLKIEIKLPEKKTNPLNISKS